MIKKVKKKVITKRFAAILATAFVLVFFISPSAHAACSNPAGTEGEKIYNTTEKMMQFCDGTNWVAMACKNEYNITPLPCNLPWGGDIPHTTNITAYQTATVPFGNTCASETRSCYNGSLSGSYTNQTCTIDPPANCTPPWGGTVNHGSDVTAYQNANEPFGGSCTSETRSCTNGTLSGNYTNQNCTVSPSICNLPWGGTINDSQTVTAYLNSNEAPGDSCTSEIRTCSGGTLSGSYTNQNCSVGSLGNVTFTPALQDSLNNRGQGWRYSNTVTFNSSGYIRLDGFSNKRYILNSDPSVPLSPGSDYINVSAGDTITLMAVNSAHGGTCSGNITITSLAGTFGWEACTKDYGSNNCSNYRQGTCSGTMLQAVTVTSGNSTSNPGGCIDLAQEMGAAAGCIQYENIVPQHYCEIYSGNHISQAGSINTITCN